MIAGRRRRRARQDISIRVKKQIVRLRDANVSWPVVLRQLPIPVTRRNNQQIMSDAAIYRDKPDDARTLDRSNRRMGKWPGLDALVYAWYLATYALGHRRIPITTALLQAERPMCFRGAENECPLPYFNQKKAWMDRHVYARR